MVKRVLISPLDWGLGHTARCIPIIQELQKQGHKVIFAGTQQQFDFVSSHAIFAEYAPLLSYDIAYSKRLPQWIKIGSQINKLKAKIRAEHKWLTDFLNKQSIDLIISDNRYGLYSRKVHSIFIGHQLKIKSPLLQTKINNIHASYINKFNECWIPDDETISLSGDLSINNKITIPTKRIGILSRLKKSDSTIAKEYDILVLLSGNEPQRSILEEKLLIELNKTNYKIALIRGTTSKLKKNFLNTTVFNLLDSTELNKLIESSQTVICRSGYSSVMDLLNFEKNIILIPTPGQTEQEYLAKHLQSTLGIKYINQNSLHLIGNALEKCTTTNLKHALKLNMPKI